MGHMLAASFDLIEMIHIHPYLAPDSSGHSDKQLQFNMTFPRAGVYRVWVQFQRKGVVNTVAFNVPVDSPCQDAVGGKFHRRGEQNMHIPGRLLESGKLRHPFRRGHAFLVCGAAQAGSVLFIPA